MDSQHRRVFVTRRQTTQMLQLIIDCFLGTGRVKKSSLCSVEAQIPRIGSGILPFPSTHHRLSRKSPTKKPRFTEDSVVSSYQHYSLVQRWLERSILTLFLFIIQTTSLAKPESRAPVNWIKSFPF